MHTTAETDSLLSDLSTALVRGDFGPCERLFSDKSAEKPLIRWAPDPMDLKDERLRTLLEIWIDERDRIGRLPHPDWVEPERLLFAIGYLMVLSVVDGGRDFRYRLYGTEISRRFMRDLTGHLVSEVPFRMSRLFFLAVYKAACIRKIPIFTEHAPPSSVNATSWSRMILPLSTDGETVDRFLVGNIPGTWRYPDDPALV